MVVQVLLFAQDYTRFLLETLRTIVHKGGGKGMPAILVNKT